MSCPECSSQMYLTYLLACWIGDAQRTRYVCKSCGQARIIFVGESELDRMAKVGENRDSETVNVSPVDKAKLQSTGT